MGGGGGTSGAVEFPGFIEDQHGLILQNSTVSDGEFDDSTLDTVNTTLTGAINNAQTADPLSSIQIPSNWDTKIENAENVLQTLKQEVDNFDTAKSSVVVNDSVSALKELRNNIQLSNPEYQMLLECPKLGDFQIGKDVGDPLNIDAGLSTSTDLDTNIPDSALTILEDALNKIQTIKSEDAEAAWESAATTIETRLDTQGFMEETDSAAVVSDAISNAQTVLNDAITVAKNIANSTEVSDVVQQFAARQEDARQRQVARFNSQMVDANAVQSSAFMIGQALIGREQQRAEAEFDAQTTLEAFKDGIQSHVQAYAQNLQTGAELEAQDAQTYNQFLQNVVETIFQLKIQGGEITQSELGQLFSNVLGQELQAHTNLDSNKLQEIQLQLQAEQNTLSRDELMIQLDELRLRKAIERSQGKFQESVARREAEDREFLQMMNRTFEILSNKRQFRSSLAELRRSKEQASVSASEAFKTWEKEIEQQKGLWDLLVLEQGANILSAPSGMARRLPEQRSGVMKAIGTGTQVAGAAASVAAAASDWRAKKNLRRIGRTPLLDLPVYTFEYLWGEESVGVIAQEAREVLPEAVFSRHGVLHVDYSMIV